MTNADIVTAFEHVADLLEYRGDNVFRVRAYRTAARTIDGLVESLASVRADTGRLPLLEELEREVPKVAFELMRVPGLGPKKVKVLVEALGINSLAALEEACRTGQVRGIKGFGPKTEAAILENLAFAQDPERARVLWNEAEAVAAALVAWMEESPAVCRVEPAGSLRRGRGELDAPSGQRMVKRQACGV